MSSYQKVYMNQIHSSSLLCQLAQMWKTQLLCDAVIKTGSVITKAHRVVLVAACPMLQSMNDATSGSHLEVRLAADIKQEAINTFLQYLYEGFMMLTEENVQDVEKVARLLQVDGIIKCCADFHKCIQSKTGVSSSQYKYTFNDLVEFRHVRVSDLQKTTHERMMKRASEMSRPQSPGSKRPRMHHPASPDDTGPMSRGYYSGGGGSTRGPPDPWDRVPQLGSGMSRSGRPSESGVIEIMEESIELVQTDPAEKGRGIRPDPKNAKGVAISVASKLNSNTDLRVINVTSDTHTTSVTDSVPSTGPSSSSQRGSITVNPLDMFGDSSSSSQSPSSLSSHQKEKQYSSSHSTKETPRQTDIHFSSQRPNMDNMSSAIKQRPSESRPSASPQRQQQQQPFPVSMPVPTGPSSTPQQKSYAAGSALQGGDMTPVMSPSVSRSSAGSSRSQPTSQTAMSPSYSSAMSIGRPQQAPPESPHSANVGGGDKSSRFKEESDISSTADLTPDLSIVKVESARSSMEEEETGGLDMYVDTSDGQMHLSHIGGGDDDVSDQEYEAPGEWESNDGSNISGDQNNSWMGSASGSYQGAGRAPFPNNRVPMSGHAPFSNNRAPILGVCNPFSTQVLSNEEITQQASSGFSQYIQNASPEHIVVCNEEKRLKVCAYCQYKDYRNKSGGRVATRHKCLACGVPLCSGTLTSRNCFQLYHELLQELQNTH